MGIFSCKGFWRTQGVSYAKVCRKICPIIGLSIKQFASSGSFPYKMSAEATHAYAWTCHVLTWLLCAVKAACRRGASIVSQTCMAANDNGHFLPASPKGGVSLQNQGQKPRRWGGKNMAPLAAKKHRRYCGKVQRVWKGHLVFYILTSYAIRPYLGNLSKIVPQVGNRQPDHRCGCLLVRLQHVTLRLKQVHEPRIVESGIGLRYIPLYCSA